MLVSIIMPIYNVDYEILRTSVQSILNQSFKNFEFLIIDDNSEKFNDPIKLNEIFCGDSRIKLLKNSHRKGVGGSLNTGIANAKGEYIFRMDADDISAKNRIEKQIDFMEKHPSVSILSSNALSFGDKKVLFKNYLQDSEIRLSLFFNSKIVHPTVCFRSDLFKTKGYLYNESVISEDYDLWLRCSLDSSIGFASLKDNLLMYRIHKNQVTTSKKEAFIKQGVELRSKFYRKAFCLEEAELCDLFAKFCFGEVKLLENELFEMQKKFFLLLKNQTKLVSTKKLRRIYWLSCLKKTFSVFKKTRKIFFKTIVIDFLKALIA